MTWSTEPQVLERIDTPRGQWVLRRVGAAYEVIANGVFLMDSRESGSERALAELALGAHGRAHRVLVGGLGLGFTLRAVLATPGVRQVTVAELEPALLRWARGPLQPLLGDALADSRCEVSLGDVSGLLAQRAGAYDVILLDVDNGPSWTVHDDNRPLYGPAGLASLRQALRGAGVAAVWSAQREDAFAARLRAVFDEVREQRVQVCREGRALEYFVYLGLAL